MAHIIGDQESKVSHGDWVFPVQGEKRRDQLEDTSQITVGDEGMTATISHSMRDSHAVTAISNLPVELLQQIFSYCAAFEGPFFGNRSYPAWTDVTHVCSHWRAAALNYPSLWTSISTDTMGKRWIKAFIERSNPSLIDLTLDFGYTTDRTNHSLNVDEVITLFEECKRLCSLRIICKSSIVCKLLGKLHTAIPIRSLSLFVIDTNKRSVVLPDIMLGGQVPIPNVYFFAIHSSIIAPHWFLRGISHFTSSQLISLRSLLNILRQMPTLHSFMLDGRVSNVGDPAAPRDIQIPMPNLMYFTVNVYKRSPTIFVKLLRRLVLPNGARKSVHLHRSLSHNPTIWKPIVLGIPPCMREVIEAANGLRHVQLSGGHLNGSFRLWTGDLGHEEAEFSFEFSWMAQGTGDGPLYPVIDLAALCDLLGVERVRTLTLLTNSRDCIDSGESASFRRTLLRKLPSAEVVEVGVSA